MNQSKNYLRSLNFNGYQWSGFDQGIHIFQKKEAKGYSIIECTPDQLSNGDIEFMTENEITLGQDRKIKARRKYFNELKFKSDPIKYRILTADRLIKYAGTGQNSWFTLEQAKAKVEYSLGEMIYEYSGPGGTKLWEIL